LLPFEPTSLQPKSGLPNYRNNSGNKSVNQHSSPFSDSVVFLELHQGVPSGVVLTNGCGEPIRKDGILIDSFSISSWVGSLIRTKR
jgi:hypothetical protein